MAARALALVVLVASSSAVACGGAETPRVTPPTAGSAAPEVASKSSVDAGAAAPAATAAKPFRKPFELHNACTEVVTVVFGEDPKRPDVYLIRLAPSSTGEGPRDDAGNQTVWLLDGTDEPLVKVRVTRGMKRVEVGRSCRTIDAR